MNWIVENWAALLAGFVAAVALLKVIAKLTPTKVDDELVARLEAAEKTLASLFPATPAQPPTGAVAKVDPKATTEVLKK
jgi:hypothetical protein